MAVPLQLISVSLGASDEEKSVYQTQYSIRGLWRASGAIGWIVTARKDAESVGSRLALDRGVSRHIWANIRPILYLKEVPDGR
jgi:hypothetical protein